MPEALSLEMSGGTPERPPVRREKRNIAIFAVLAVILLVAAGISWVYMGQIESIQAQFDGMVYTVEAPASGTLASVEVGRGDQVGMGQTLAVMEKAPESPQRNEAARDIAALARQGRLEAPSMEEMAARVRRAQEAEKEIATRLGNARSQEEAMRRTREQKVLEHVRAQLAMRSGRYAEDGARKAEAAARASMETARSDFERASLQRAAIERELERIRADLARAGKRAAATPAAAAAGSAQQKAAGDGIIAAPCAGSVIKSSAEAGMAVEAGQPLFMLQPSGGEPDSYWALAWFAPADAGRIRAGQPCSIKVPGMGDLAGKVAEVLPEREIPAGNEKNGGAGSRAGQRALPVRIKFETLPPGRLAMGTPLSCEVNTRSIFGFDGF